MAGSYSLLVEGKDIYIQIMVEFLVILSIARCPARCMLHSFVKAMYGVAEDAVRCICEDSIERR